MKIAIPTNQENVDDHFGHCQYYTVYTVDSEKKLITEKQQLPAPRGCGCKSNIASVLQEMGVEVMLAGHMGEGASRVLASHGIRVIRGCSGKVQTVLTAYLQGYLLDSGNACDHSDTTHQCLHH